MLSPWISRFAETLPRSARIVLQPDHPLLGQGPELLAAVAGPPTAFFFCNSGGRTLASLASRVVLARLALPADTAVVLVERGDRLVVDHVTATFADEVLVHTGAKRLRELPVRRRTANDPIEVIRPLHYERFAEAWSRTSGSEVTPSRPVQGRPTSEIFGTARRRIQNISNHPHERSYSRPAYRRQMAQEIQAVVSDDYGLSFGVGAIADVAGMLYGGDGYLAAHEVGYVLPPPRRAIFDAAKPARAAAFAGIVSRVASE